MLVRQINTTSVASSWFWEPKEMATQSDKLRWKTWADSLRQEMMISLTPQISKSVEEVAAETGTTKAKKTLRSAAFWRACQSGATANDSLVAAGFEIEFEEGPENGVNEVTLRLNATWMGIMQRVLDRKAQ